MMTDARSSQLSQPDDSQPDDSPPGRLSDQSPLSIAASVEVGLDLCDVLADLHLSGRGHGGVRLDNVGRASSGPVRVFGEPVEGAQPGEDVIAIAALIYRLVAGEDPDPAGYQSGLLRQLRPDVPIELVEAIDDVFAGRTGDLPRLRSTLGAVPGRSDHASLWLPFWVFAVAAVVVAVVYLSVPDRLIIDATLFVKSGDRSEPFDVVNSVAADDGRFFLELMSTDRARVYVVTEDGSGQVVAIEDAVVPAVREARIPAEGAWRVQGEHLVLVVIREGARPQEEAEVDRCYRQLGAPAGDPLLAAIEFRRSIVRALGRAGSRYSNDELPPSLVALSEPLGYGGPLRIQAFRLK